GMDTIPTWYEYVYTDSNRVYNYEFGNFYMLYDFNAQVGDWWEVAAREYYYACDSTGKVQVDSVSTTVINGDTLKVLYTSQKDSSHWSFVVRIIERIGCTSYLFPHPYTYCGVTFHDEYGPLRCYQDSAFNVYETGAADSCNHIDVLSIEDNPGVAMNISVFPNPFGVSTTIVIKNSQFYHVGEKDLSLVVYDILGKQIPTDFSVRQKTDQQVEIELWRGEMRSGMYFYILSTGENIVYNGKLIVD
ncbi:MAG: T9SS type A sorting domain-containing protein, partial [Bacteroidetes bacterium]|nr:T9SS type A sorting domain-containing protein [Bacteroidota bacterium]